MTIPVRLRHPLVVLGVILSLVAGAATIRAAAAWTAASAPLAAKPPSIENLQSQLAAEEARSAALRSQLDELLSGSSDLISALGVAKDRIAADATQAGALQARLTDAKQKLAALERSIRAAQQAGPSRPGATPRPAATPRPGGGTDD